MKKILIAGLFSIVSLTSLSFAADTATINPHGSSPHGSSDAVADIGDVNVSKATGQNAYTVAEIVDQSVSLKDKKVVVRGKVVKFSPEIMGKNWIHLRDGSGTVVGKNNDLVITSKDQVKVGAVVTIRGIVHTSKDFGHGYSYDVILEDATVSSK